MVDGGKTGPQREDAAFMGLALAEARCALPQDVPVGAVIVRDGAVIAAGHNLREKQGNVLLHAEIEAISKACAALGRWSLSGCTLYVTLEPCPMCAGAILQARISRVVYGAPDEKAGACGSVFDLFAMPFSPRPDVTGRVLEEECARLLQEFFTNLRESEKNSCILPEDTV